MKRKLPIAVETEFEFESYNFILRLLKILSIIIGKKFFYRVAINYKRGNRLELRLVNLLDNNAIISSSVHFSNQFDSIQNPDLLDKTLEDFADKWRKEIFSTLKYSYKAKKVKTFNLANSLLVQYFGQFFDKQSKNTFSLI